jgi:hypothetical protein
MILTEFSVRPAERLGATDLSPSEGLSPQGGRYRRGTEHLDSCLPEYSRAFSEAAARCHQVVDNNDRRVRPERSPQSERASQILLTGSRTEPCLISDFPSLSKR